MLILALDSALTRCGAAVLRDTAVLAACHEDLQRGQAGRLPVIVQAVLDQAGIVATELGLIAATVGPGSFTGIRAGLALAHGIALSAGCPLVGVTVGEALAEALPPLAPRALWTTIDSRRGRVFLERNGAVATFAFEALPRPDGPIALAGDAAPTAAAWLAARDSDVMLTRARLPTPSHVALAGRRRSLGELPPRPAQPLYVDPPEARLPAGGLRPPPVAA